MSELSVGQLKGLTVNNNVITVPSGHTLYAPGSVVQVQDSMITSTFTTNAKESWFSIPNFSVVITPKFNNSKIMITVNIGRWTGTNATLFRVLRNGVEFDLPDVAGSRLRPHFVVSNYGVDANHADGGRSFTVSDFPGTVSATTYQVQALNEGAGVHSTLFALNRSYNDSDSALSYHGRTISTVSAMEVAQ